jgi:hypothetical protein
VLTGEIASTIGFVACSYLFGEVLRCYELNPQLNNVDHDAEFEYRPRPYLRRLEPIFDHHHVCNCAILYGFFCRGPIDFDHEVRATARVVAFTSIMTCCFDALRGYLL